MAESTDGDILTPAEIGPLIVRQLQLVTLTLKPLINTPALCASLSTLPSAR
ncbi:MAG: hypothetical protein H0X40_06585 [Chthoniobacterales bacterium]|nr:hypothetical protein [Chthoniobacterales bacterium]